ALSLLIVEKVPTAYIVPPHCTSWRICSTGLSSVVIRCGVSPGGVGDTAPAGGEAAKDGAAMPATLSPATAVITPALPHCLKPPRDTAHPPAWSLRSSCAFVFRSSSLRAQVTDYATS